MSDQEGGRIPLHDTSEVSAPEGGSTEHDDSYEGAGYTGAAADVERLLNRIAEQRDHGVGAPADRGADRTGPEHSLMGTSMTASARRFIGLLPSVRN